VAVVDLSQQDNKAIRRNRVAGSRVGRQVKRPGFDFAAMTKTVYRTIGSRKPKLGHRKSNSSRIGQSQQAFVSSLYVHFADKSR
jgi:hypothetical protein